MKKTLCASLALLALTACQSTSNSQEHTLNYLLENPLYAERYAESMVDTMVNLEIYNDPTIEDENKRKIADTAKEKWLKIAQEARKEQRKGAKGQFIPAQEYAAGEVLYLNDTIFLAPDFDSSVGPSMHFFLTTVVDPRDVEFPDETAMDIGEIQSNLGTGRYSVPTVENPKSFRTLVLWDTKLERIYGFAQLNPLY